MVGTDVVFEKMMILPFSKSVKCSKFVGLLVVLVEGKESGPRYYILARSHLGR
jgi:hypothetical protein